MADVVIVGAGPAGMAAAVSAAASGMQVALLDDNPEPGGQIWRWGDPRVPWFRRLANSSVQVIVGARIVSGNPVRRTLLVETGESAFTLTYGKLILATGARELFLPFPGWTAPNVMGVGGLQALVKSGFSVAGKRVIVSGSGPFLLASAGYLVKCGAVVSLIAEQASRGNLLRFAAGLLRDPGKLIQAVGLRLQLRRTRYLTSCWVEAVDENKATLRRGSRVWKEPFDLLATGFGFRPNVELAGLLGCAIGLDGTTVNGEQQTSLLDIYAAGECTGIGGVDQALIEGERAGLAAAGRVEAVVRLNSKHRTAVRFGRALHEAFALRDELKSLPRGETVICRCEDVCWDRLRDERSRREAKLYTRCGMGPCQGRICGPILDFLQAPDRDTFRPPVFPARLETLATTEEMTGR